MKSLSVTAFSIHMEAKLYPVDHPKYGCVYLHFHVVSGFIDVNKAQMLWKRVVKFEYALTFDKLEKCISKYASKTPVVGRFSDVDLYHLLVYKTRMHRYSVPLSKCELIKREQVYFLEKLLVKEVYKDIKKHIRRHGGVFLNG